MEALAARHGKAVQVGPVFDTIKLVQGGFVRATLDRDHLLWPLAWAYRPDLAPVTEPPEAEWFEGAAVVPLPSQRERLGEGTSGPP